MEKTGSRASIVPIILAATLNWAAPREALAQGTWVTKTPMPTARWQSSVGLIGEQIYVANGYNPAIGGALTQVEAYNIVSNSWVSKPPQPFLQDAAAYSVINGLLYIAGGGNCCVGIANANAYNPGTDSWTSLAALPQAEEFPAGDTINGLFYVAGVNYTTPTTTTLDVFNPGSGLWTAKTSMPTPRYFPGACAINGILYVVGGSDPNTGNGLSTVEAYNPATDSWTTKASMPTPRTRVAVAELNGILYAIGGASREGLNPTIMHAVEAYDPTLNVWTEQPIMPTARASLQAVAANGSIYAIGGYASNEYTAFSTVEAFTPSPAISIQMYPGITINAPVGSTNEIQYVNNLGNSNWMTLTNLVLPITPYIYVDFTAPGQSQRFYRDILVQ
jgi:N-acetylneuraminic acid mutarotase